MYLRPGNLNKDFCIACEQEIITGNGRPKKMFAPTDDRLKGILAEAKTDERMRWQQLQHPITHTIVQQGSPRAQTGDLLLMGGRSFFVQGTDDVAALGVWTLYYVEERFDVNGGSG